MKQNYLKKLILCLCLLAGTTNALAYDAEIDGIYYDFSGNEATVTYKDYHYGSYSGEVTIPSSVTCNGTTYSVTSIGMNAFYGCRSLTSVNIGNSVTSIGDWAFSSCKSLTSVTIPNSVTSIGYDAFNGCSSLTSVTIPGSVTSIGYGAFYDCSGLKSVTIPESVTSIGTSAFQWCSGLTSVTIPNSVTSIGDCAFWDCSSLTSITIPNSVTSISSEAFAYCSGLTSIIVEEGNTVYDSRGNCNAIIETGSNTLISGCQNTIIPESVTSIGEEAFYGCVRLVSIVIPESVTSIGTQAFVGCSGLTSVTIPNSVTSIGDCAFWDCSSLTDVYCLAEKVPETDSSAFEGTPVESATLHVPASAIKAYKATLPWSNFGSIVSLTDAVEDVQAEGIAAEADRYDLQGRRTITPKRGINIVRMSDGTARKVLVK